MYEWVGFAIIETVIVLILLFILNIIFVGAVWHMDVSHNIDRLGQKITRGVFHVSPQTAYRYSQYTLIACLLLIDILFVVKFFANS